ncbi:hypothetical protein, partial [Streptomyces sp. P17]|uniref:hypothetical protein n=1 Tax=Streptomyces sp. P17 TaxID=3074716 RepID=UPI0028F3F218
DSVKHAKQAKMTSNVSNIKGLRCPDYALFSFIFAYFQSAMKDAFVVTNRLGVSSKSRERDRRPTLDELDKLMEHFGAR